MSSRIFMPRSFYIRILREIYIHYARARTTCVVHFCDNGKITAFSQMNMAERERERERGDFIMPHTAFTSFTFSIKLLFTVFIE